MQGQMMCMFHTKRLVGPLQVSIMARSLQLELLETTRRLNTKSPEILGQLAAQSRCGVHLTGTLIPPAILVSIKRGRAKASSFKETSQTFFQISLLLARPTMRVSRSMRGTIY